MPNLPVRRLVTAGLGLAAAARYLPRLLVHAPGIAKGVVRTGYDLLADRGAKVLGRDDDAETRRNDDDGVVARLAEPSAPPTTDDQPAATGEAVLDHADLPLPDYDHLTLGSLRARIRKLSAREVEQLRDYERAHADRAPVLVMFENRLRALSETAATE